MFVALHFCSFKCSCKGFSGKGSGKRFSGKGVANVLVAKVWQRCYATKTKGKRSATRLPLNTPLQPPTFATTNVCHKHPFTASFASRQDFSAIIVMSNVEVSPNKSSPFATPVPQLWFVQFSSGQCHAPFDFFHCVAFCWPG